MNFPGNNLPPPTQPEQVFEVFLDGVPYRSAADIARAHGYVRDYVPRLCRQGHVRGRQVGKNWYVDDGSFQSFLISQEYAKRKRRASLTRERVREYHASDQPARRPEIYRPAPAPTSFDDITEIPPPHPAAPVANGASAIQAQMATSLAALGDKTFSRAKGLIDTPTGLSHAALSSAHVPAYTLAPLVEFLHKLIALTLAFMIALGMYAAVNPQAAHFAADSVREQFDSIASAYRAATGGGFSTLVRHSESQVAAASNALASSIPNVFSSLARMLQFHHQ